MTPPHRHLLSLFAQTMVYTIHEIPIFIAMGVVGKGRPTQDTAPDPRHWLAPPSGNKACGGVRACGTPGQAWL